MIEQEGRSAISAEENPRLKSKLDRSKDVIVPAGETIDRSGASK